MDTLLGLPEAEFLTFAQHCLKRKPQFMFVTFTESYSVPDTVSSHHESCFSPPSSVVLPVEHQEARTQVKVSPFQHNCHMPVA